MGYGQQLSAVVAAQGDQQSAGGQWDGVGLQEDLGRVVGVRHARRIIREYPDPQALLSAIRDRTFCGEDKALLKLAESVAVVDSLLFACAARAGDLMDSPAAVIAYLKSHLGGRQDEVFTVLFLDNQNRLIAAEDLFHGTLAQTAVYPRVVLKRALAYNAGAVVAAHNHPSGLSEPSHSDRLLTDALRAALSHVEVRLLDHFIVAGNDTVSFAERGLL